MIIVRTPLRISLVGGGTDMPAFYQRAGFGAVVSFAINKYVYVTINPHFGGGVRVSYSETENVARPEDLKHDLIREALLMYGVDDVEVVTVADIPGNGTGLGSSSSLSVGLMTGLRRYTGEKDYPGVDARQAYLLESDFCKHPVGKQDHWAAAYGGLHYWQFNTDGEVNNRLLVLTANERLEIERRFILLWTGKTRSANDILTAQSEGFSDIDHMRAGMNMRDTAVALRDDLINHNFGRIGDYLNFGWKMKKTLARGISDSSLDAIYDAGMDAGALGGKLCGAGGGGFFLFYAPPERADAIVEATGLKRMLFGIDTKGSEVVYET